MCDFTRLSQAIAGFPVPPCQESAWVMHVCSRALHACAQGFGASPDAPQLLRVGVHFSDKPMSRTPSSSFLSDMLGRTAHVALIESDDFARLLAWGVVQRYEHVYGEPQSWEPIAGTTPQQ